METIVGTPIYVAPEVL